MIPKRNPNQMNSRSISREPISAVYLKTRHPAEQTLKTIRLIGKAIQEGSRYAPLILHARKLAVRAPPKDYLGQVQHIYDDFVKRWRYTYDPVGLETIATSPKALFSLVIAGDGVGLGEGRGGGDCDEAVAGIGALLQAVGFRARLATTSPPHAGPETSYTHIFPQAYVPTVGWMTVDPVLYPKNSCGTIAPHSKVGYWDLNGRLIARDGALPKYLRRREGGLLMGSAEQWQDYGLSGTDLEYPDDWRELMSGFGTYVDTMGYSDGGDYNLVAEVVPDADGFVRSPMLEFAADDYEYLRYRGRPYDGMVALGDDGEIYQWDGNLGFFKRLFRRVKRRVKKVARKIGRGVKRFIKKLPGGKYLVRLGRKILKVSMKLVRPLAKYVGKYAKYLAPVAALIPGVGPAVSAGLYTAGKVANLMNKYGVRFIPGPKGVKQLKFRKPSQAAAFKKALKRAAAKEQARRVRRPRRVRGRRFSRPVLGEVYRAGTPAHAAYMRDMIR